MASRNRSSASPSPRRGRPTRAEASLWPEALPSRAELAAAFGQALDLAEGRTPGHATRVCFVAVHLAEAVGLPPKERRAAYYGALLHDAGAAPASAELCRLLNVTEDVLFANKLGTSPQQLAMEIAPFNVAAVVEVLRSHLEEGGRVAADLGFDDAVRKAILSHHERWDGHGYPRAQKGDAIPAAGRVIAAADMLESLISADGNPLVARRNLIAELALHGGGALDPEIAEAALDLAREDDFWLGLHHEELSREVAELGPDAGEPSAGELLRFAEVFADLADAKGEHTDRHSQRVADVALEIGELIGMSEERRELLRVAGLLHDIGLLGVPARVIAKPDILSLSEMELMRKHPTFSQTVLQDLPGMDDVARWVGAHHERPDGRGYPEMLDADEAEPEARILAIADTYVALTSPRPYRGALSEEDAQQVLQGGAGTQLDPKLVQLFCSRPVSTSSRTARRRARKR